MSDLREVKGTITLADGSVSQFALTDNGWEQWGERRERLGRSVDVVEALAAAIEYDMWAEEG